MWTHSLHIRKPFLQEEDIPYKKALIKVDWVLTLFLHDQKLD